MQSSEKERIRQEKIRNTIRMHFYLKKRSALRMLENIALKYPNIIETEHRA